MHFVTPGLDSGPIIAQAAVPVLAGDDEESVAARVLAEEHRLYPQAVRWLCENHVQLDGDAVVYNGGTYPMKALVSPALTSFT